MHDHRCSVRRTKHGGYKDGRFEMQDSFTGVTLAALRTTHSHSYNIFMYSGIAGMPVLVKAGNTCLVMCSGSTCDII